MSVDESVDMSTDGAYCVHDPKKKILKSKAPVSQLVNADVNSRVTVLKAVLASN